MKLPIAFFKGTGCVSKAIEYFNSGPFSHCAYLWSETEYLDSRADVLGGIAAGVQIRPMELEKDPHTILELDVTAEQLGNFRDFLQAQLGKPYDKAGIIFSFALGRDWRDPAAWWCSEVDGAAFEIAGITPKLITPLGKLTPSGLATIMSALGAVVVPPS